jgi:hypothetical protein
MDRLADLNDGLFFLIFATKGAASSWLSSQLISLNVIASADQLQTNQKDQLGPAMRSRLGF